MKLNVQDKIGYDILTTDGKKETLNELIFDAKKWTIRYLQITDSDKGFKLLPVELITNKDWIGETLQLSISSETLKALPTFPTNQEINRKVETAIFKQLDLRPYWKAKYVSSMSKPTRYAPDKVLKIDTEYRKRVKMQAIKGSYFSNKLIASSELNQISIEKAHQSLGELKDLIFDATNWRISAVIYSPSGSSKLSQQIMTQLSCVRSLDGTTGKMTFYSEPSRNLSKSFDPKKTVNTLHVLKSFDFSGKPINA